MGGGVSKEKKLSLSSQIKNEEFIKKNCALYCNVEREEYKLNSDILKNMEKMNKFSKDEEAESIHTKKKR